MRTTDAYTNEEVVDIIRRNVSCDVTPRSLRLRANVIPATHPLVAAGLSLGLEMYASPTTSNKALIPFPALKLGPGESARSHTTDEFVFIREISDGIDLYITLLERILRGGLNK